MNAVAQIRSGFTTQEAAGHPSLRQHTALWQDSNHLCSPLRYGNRISPRGRRP
jgi:hypothetical protein